MTRCTHIIADQRQCTLLDGHDGKHLVAPAFITRESAAKIMLRRGWSPSAQSPVLRGAFSAGDAMPSSRFVLMLETAERAGLKR